MKTAVILQGWAGGAWHTKKLADLLEKNDIRVISDKRAADIIIAHSVGTYDIPSGIHAELIMLIDPPYWPGKSIISRLFKKEHADTKTVRQLYGNKYWLAKKFWEGVYIILKPSYSFLAPRQVPISELLAHMAGRKVLVVRNKVDAFLTPDIRNQLQDYENVKYIELPGEHDDYYTNPQPYVDLLLKAL